MKPEIIAAITAGTFVMFGIMMICRIWRKKEIPVWKLAVMAPVLTMCGTFGAYLLYFIENMKWGGISFYGSLFVIPVLFVPFAFLIKVRYGVLLDYCAPAVCIMLAINKINCLRTGCCRGIVLRHIADGSAVRFPSQIVELCTALVIMVVLILLISRKKMRTMIYPLFLIIYGVTRFGWNLLRETKPFIMNLPAGNFWSLVAILIGSVWLVIALNLVKKQQKSDKKVGKN